MAGSGGISPSRLHLCLPWLLRFTLLEPFRVYERLRYDKHIVDVELPEDPIFVLGHWRSGTSYLQELLSADSRFATCTMFDSLAPECNLATRRFLAPACDRIFRILNTRYAIQDRPMHMSLPAEDDVAMLCLTDTSSPNWGHLFPRRAQEFFCSDAPSDWAESHRYLVKKLTLAHGGKRLVLKSPMHMARVAEIIRAYPNAKFVYIHRHPFDTFASNRRLWRMIRNQSALQWVSDNDVDEIIKDTFTYLLDAWLRDRKLVPEHQRVEVSLDQLNSDSMATLGEIYSSLGLGEFPNSDLQRVMTAQSKVSTHPTDLDPRLQSELRERWSAAFEAWGYY